MNKPYHLMTPAERTAARIAQNRAISDKIAEGKTQAPQARSTGARSTSAQSTGEGTRATPEERASKLGSLIRKVPS